MVIGAMPYTSPEKTDDILAGIAHTHAAYDGRYNNNEFSSADKRISDFFNVPIYVATPNGSFQKYENGDTRIIDTNMPSDSQDPNRYNDAPLFDSNANNESQQYSNKAWNGNYFYDVRKINEQ